MDQDYGCPTAENLDPLSDLSQGSACGTTTQTKSITFSGGTTPLMLESPVQRNLHAGFGGGHSEKGSHVPRRVPTLHLSPANILYFLVSGTFNGRYLSKK